MKNKPNTRCTVCGRTRYESWIDPRKNPKIKWWKKIGILDSISGIFNEEVCSKCYDPSPFNKEQYTHGGR